MSDGNGDEDGKNAVSFLFLKKRLYGYPENFLVTCLGLVVGDGWCESVEIYEKERRPGLV